MKRHVMNALIAGAITAIAGVALYAGIAASNAWLAAPAYMLMAPGLILVFFFGLGSGGHGAVIHTDIAPYLVTFLMWWGLLTLLSALTRRARTATTP